MARLLLIEDHPLVHRVLCDMLKEEGHDADCVETHDAGLRALADENYDLVITDVRLPGGSGHDIADAAERAGMKTLLVTGHPDEIRILAAKAIPYLIKPFRPEAFVAAVRQLLAG